MSERLRPTRSGDPKSYYANSRLSFIGLWRNRIDELVSKTLNGRQVDADAKLSAELDTLFVDLRCICRTPQAFSNAEVNVPRTQHLHGNMPLTSSHSVTAGIPPPIAEMRAPSPAVTGDAILLHVDADCFFVAVALASGFLPNQRRDAVVNSTAPVLHPMGVSSMTAAFDATPVAVTSGHLRTSEVCSANYAARSFGVRNGSSLCSALAKCPSLICIPTSVELFGSLESASNRLMTLLWDTFSLRWPITGEGVTESSRVGGICPLSCDEAFCDATRLIFDALCVAHSGTTSGCSTTTSQQPPNGSRWNPWRDTPTCPGGEICRREIISTVLHRLRSIIAQHLGFDVSIGCGHSQTVARAATRKAKPCGIAVVMPSESQQFLADLPLRNVHGIGYSTAKQLSDVILRSRTQSVDPGKEDEDDLRPFRSESSVGEDAYLDTHTAAALNASDATREDLAQALTVADALRLSQDILIRDFGAARAHRLRNLLCGVPTPFQGLNLDKPTGRSSISVEMSWGVRVSPGQQGEEETVSKYIEPLASELAKRLTNARSTPGRVTMRLAVRAPTAAVNPAKYLGCGQCNWYSKSSAFDHQSFAKFLKPSESKPSTASGDSSSALCAFLVKLAKSLFSLFLCDTILPRIEDLRGISLCASKMRPTDPLAALQSAASRIRNAQRRKIAERGDLGPAGSLKRYFAAAASDTCTSTRKRRMAISGSSSGVLSRKRTPVPPLAAAIIDVSDSASSKARSTCSATMPPVAEPCNSSASSSSPTSSLGKETFLGTYARADSMSSVHSSTEGDLLYF